ncbi:hypothetical protein SAMN05421863_11037 [Nitrosomonas communis]|uniref:Uncharacterized protein n=1 Tax=Nitrosomonas communis TaxID=44574 RepID=A0A1I4W9E3_9PROT|nr:hypothetical protein SAMN05421863_11037 [Nitrosomonas communis]
MIYLIINHNNFMVFNKLTLSITSLFIFKIYTTTLDLLIAELATEKKIAFE